MRSQAIHLYISAMRGGVPEAGRKAGVWLFELGERRQGKALLREAVREGDTMAAKILAEWLWSEDAGELEADDLDVNEFEEEEMDDEVQNQPDPKKSIGTSRSRREAFRLWRKAADDDDVPSIRRVAECYATGEGPGSRDMDKSIEYWEKAAAKGDRSAIAALARYYHQQAAVLLSSGRIEDKNRTANAQCDDGDSHTDDETKLLRYTRLAASDGDAFCLIRLAEAHLLGSDGIQQDAIAAIQFYMTAAAHGDVSARAAAADIYYHGAENVPRDRLRAFALYAQSAKDGWAPSFKALADCYRTGQGGKPAGDGPIAGIANICLVAPDDKPDLNLAYAYYTEAAQQGCISSLKILGDLHWSGYGCEKDRGKAAELYERAAAAGDMEAEQCLARCYWLGHGTQKDRDKAKEIWRGIASKGHGLDDDDMKRLDMMDDEAFEDLMEREY